MRGLLLSVGLIVTLAMAPAAVAPRQGHVQQFWPNGHLKSDATYTDDAYDGEVRTWYENGAPYELRHYRSGHEEGVQQSWTDAGVLYLNYEVRDGRRFGLVNASPCNAVGDRVEHRQTDGGRDVAAKKIAASDAAPAPADGSGLPYYDEATFTPQWSPVSHRVAPFSLPTQAGTSVSDETLRGHPYVASFIFTQCSAVCPLLVHQLTRVQAAIAGGDARIVSFSVTPDTDTPTVLASFGRARGIDSRIWSLVSGPKRSIYQLARTSYFADDSRVGNAPDDETAFLHTEKLLLVDGEGHLRGVYNGTQPHAIDQLIADLARLAGRTYS